MSLSEAISIAAKDCIYQALQDAGDDRTQAAKLLSVNRTVFYRLCKRYGVELTRRHSVGNWAQHGL